MEKIATPSEKLSEGVVNGFSNTGGDPITQGEMQATYKEDAAPSPMETLPPAVPAGE